MATSPTALAERVYQLGERMAAALDAGRLKTFAALVDERSLYVERLQDTLMPDDVETTWRPKLARQHEALTQALDTRLQHLMDAMHQTERLDKAHREYQRPDAPRGVLHDDFSI